MLWIDDYVTGIKEVSNSNDIYEIYDYLDLKIKKLEPGNILLAGKEASYLRSYNDDEIVFIRSDLDYRYEKFILAHELGHAILHTELRQACFNSQLFNHGKYERQANYFAFKLLDYDIDPIQYEQFTTEQIAKKLYIPKDVLE